MLSLVASGCEVLHCAGAPSAESLDVKSSKQIGQDVAT